MQRAVVPRLLIGTGSRNTLVVLLHGCTWLPSRRRSQLTDVVTTIRQAIPAADVFAPLLPIEFWSLQNPDGILEDLLGAVDTVWRQRQEADGSSTSYDRVILVGFSFGSVLIRALYCAAAGARPDGSVDAATARPWQRRVERVILLAGLNRGWTTDSPVTRLESLLNNIGTAIGHALPRKPTLFAIRRGAPFLTRMRLQWLALQSHAATPPITIQLLGTRDDIVSPTDNVDLATGAGFFYLEVPRSGHFDVVDMPATAEGALRRERLRLALLGSREAVATEAIPAAELVQLLPATTDPGDMSSLGASQSGAAASREDVVLVVHGIRDKGYWTRKIARVVAGNGGGRVVAVAPTYGYFALLPFLLPWTRRAKIEWLLDLYVSIRAAHPGAAISFIGHSNGTYILAGAMAASPAVRFKNVVFAGSVVRSDFPWPSYVAKGQVQRVLNYVATADWVVAIFPRLLQRLSLQDLGGAGHDGFRTVSTSITNVQYVAGRHSAALDEEHWTEIAAFILRGEPPAGEVRVRSTWVVALAHTAAVIWLALAALIVVPTYLILLSLGFPEVTTLDMFESWRTTAAGATPPWLGAVLLTGWVKVVAAALTRL